MGNGAEALSCNVSAAQADRSASERRISVFDKANASHYAPGHRCLTSSLASAFILDVALC